MGAGYQEWAGSETRKNVKSSLYVLSLVCDNPQNHNIR